MPDRKPLKLLVVTMMYEPDCVGIAAIASDMCAALAERGHDVTVYTTHPYYPEWKRKSKSRRWRIEHDSIRNVQVRRHRIFIPSNPSRLFSRLVHELSFPLSLLKSLLHSRKFDLVMVFCPLMGAVAFASLRKMLFGGPLWVNVQDIPVEAASASGFIRSRLLNRMLSWVQGFMFNRADVWSSISPDMVQQLETMNSAGTQIHLCRNWLIDPLREQISRLDDKVGRIPQQPPKLLYCGTIGKKQGLLQFCQQLSKCNHDFKLQIRGQGSEAPAVEKFVKCQGDGRFEFFDTLSTQTEFVRAIQDADWCVIPQKSSAGHSFFPSKLIPSIFIGTPILAISDDSGPLGHEVSQNGLGLVVPWSGVDQLMNQLNALSLAPAKYEQLQRNCVDRAQMYEREFAIDNFEMLLRELRFQHNSNSTDGKSMASRHSDSNRTTQLVKTDR